MYPRKSGTITLKSGVSTTYSFATTTKWYDCKWKHPKFEGPCSIFSGTNSQLCHWNGPNGRTWTVRAESHYNCSITSTSISEFDTEGDWNCALDSFPLENDKDKYESVQEYFSVRTVKPAQGILIHHISYVLYNLIRYFFS